MSIEWILYAAFGSCLGAYGFYLMYKDHKEKKH